MKSSCHLLHESLSQTLLHTTALTIIQVPAAAAPPTGVVATPVATPIPVHIG